MNHGEYRYERAKAEGRRKTRLHKKLSAKMLEMLRFFAELPGGIGSVYAQGAGAFNTSRALVDRGLLWPHGILGKELYITDRGREAIVRGYAPPRTWKPRATVAEVPSVESGAVS